MITGEWSTLSLTLAIGDTSDYYSVKISSLYVCWLTEEQIFNLRQSFDDSICGLGAEGWIDEFGSRRVDLSILIKWHET